MKQNISRKSSHCSADVIRRRMTRLAVLTTQLALATPAVAFYDTGSSGTWSNPNVSPAAADAVVVLLTDQLRFEPVEIRIRTGDTIEWRNVGSIPHTVSADPSLAVDGSNIRLPNGVAPFDSLWIAGKSVYRRTFDSPGEYRYVCLPHEKAGMLGRIVVN